MPKVLSQADIGGVLARTRLKRAGGSLVVTVPASARNLLSLTEGQEVDVSVEGGRVVLDPVGRGTRTVRPPRYTLDELIADRDPAVALSDEERAWHDETAVGHETW